MGLDAYELILEIEDHFGVDFRDKELEKIHTVGDFVSLVESRINATPVNCITLTNFLKVRHVVRDTCSIPNLKVHPKQHIIHLLNAPQRQRFWHALGKQQGKTLPPLIHSSRLQSVLHAISGILIGLAFFVAFKIDWNIWPLTFFVAGLIIWLLFSVTKPFRTYPPSGWQTFGEISRRIVGFTFATKQLHLKSRDEILQEIKPIFVDVVGVDADEVIPEALLVKDLGLG